MKKIIDLYYIVLILFRLPVYLIHESLHAIFAILIGRGVYDFSFNFSFKERSCSPIVRTYFTGKYWKEVVIVCAPVLGVIVPLVLSLCSSFFILDIFTFYMLINIKYALPSDIDAYHIREMKDWKSYLKKLEYEI